MTEKQLKYAKKLRSQVMITSKKQRGWDSEEAHEYFAEWGYGLSLRKLTIKQLKDLLHTLRSPGYDKPGKPLSEMAVTHPSAPGMATAKQIRYAGVLAGRYAKLRGILPKDAYASFHAWVNKYQKVDAIQFCTIEKATEVISIMGRVFITTFGAKEFESLTGKTWAYRGTRYRKYQDKQPNRLGMGAV